MHDDASRYRIAISSIQGGFAPVRYWRASLWTLAIQFAVGAILWGVGQPGKGPYGTDPDVLFLGKAAFLAYVVAVSVGHFGVGAWLAARGTYGIIRCLSLLMASVTVAILVLVPIYIAIFAPSVNNFQACDTLKCTLLIPIGSSAIVGAMALSGIIPVSLLWFALAKPPADGRVGK